MAGDDTMQRFLAKLRDILRGKVKDGDLSASDFDTAVHQAAGHVGGLARAEKAREEDARTFPYQGLDDLPDDVAKALPPDAQSVWMAAYNSAHKQRPDDEARCAQTAWAAVKRAGYGKDDSGTWKKIAAEGSTMGRLGFLAPVELAEDKATGKVQIFPRAGTYGHPEYGDIKIDGAFLKEVKQNFDSKIYQQELPLTVDLEHQTQLSGAAGWISALEVRGNDGLWATVEFNERGKELVGADAFRYFSPTYYDEWRDPATGKTYSNVLVGGALTNHPFFKGMEPVLMTAGEGVYCFVEPIRAAEDEDVSTEDQTTLDSLNEYLQAFGSFEDAEVEGLSASALDAAIAAIDELADDSTEAAEFAGGHAGHTGHKGHGGGSSGEMGYASKKAARTRVMKQLNGDRTGLLRELKTLRTMKLHSPAAAGMRKGMIKEAQKALLATRRKMLAARAKYRSEPNIGAEGDGMDMMACMRQMMAMMGQMTKMMPDEAKGKADAMMAKAEGLMDQMKKEHPDAHPSPGGRSDRQAMIEQILSESRVPVQAGQIGAEAVRAQLEAIGASEAETSTVLTSLGLDATKGGASMGMNDDEARQFKELTDGFKTLSTKVEAAEARASKAETDLRTANETISAMSRAEKRRELSEFVRSNRFAFQGEVDACVDKLEKLRGQLDAETFGELLEEKRTMSERVKASGMFEQIGTGKAAAGSVTAQFDAAIKAAETVGVKGAEAIAKVAGENPELYRRYNDEHNSRAKRSGGE